MDYFHLSFLDRQLLVAFEFLERLLTCIAVMQGFASGRTERAGKMGIIRATEWANSGFAFSAQQGFQGAEFIGK